MVYTHKKTVKRGVNGVKKKYKDIITLEAGEQWETADIIFPDWILWPESQPIEEACSDLSVDLEQVGF